MAEKKPPECPICGGLLETVIPEKHGEVYYWDWEEGMFKLDDAQVTIVYVCGECGKPIGGWKSNGERWGFVPETE